MFVLQLNLYRKIKSGCWSYSHLVYLSLLQKYQTITKLVSRTPKPESFYLCTEYIIKHLYPTVTRENVKHFLFIISSIKVILQIHIFFNSIFNIFFNINYVLCEGRPNILKYLLLARLKISIQYW